MIRFLGWGAKIPVRGNIGAAVCMETQPDAAQSMTHTLRLVNAHFSLLVHAQYMRG